MEINQNLQNLYAAKQDQKAYKDYKAAAKKGEETEELFAKADINGDGKITKADEKAAKKEISTLTNAKKTPNLFDMDGDEKVNVKDLLALNTLEDIDGDGVLSDAEKAFIEEQEKALIKKLEKQKNKKEYDFNEDGKYNLYDVQAFLDTIGDRDIYHSDDATDKYLVKVLEKMNKKFFISSTSKEGKTNIQCKNEDVAMWRLEVQKELLESLQDKTINEVLNNLEEEMQLRWELRETTILKKLDIDGSGIINENDLALINTGISALSKQLGISTSPNGVEEKKLAYDDAKANEAAARTAYKNATKSEKKRLKQEYNLFKEKTKRAKYEYDRTIRNQNNWSGEKSSSIPIMGGIPNKKGEKYYVLTDAGEGSTSLNGIKRNRNKMETPTIKFNQTFETTTSIHDTPTIETPPADNNENAQDNLNVTVNNNTENTVQEEKTEPKKEYKIPSKIKNLAAKHAPNLSEQEVYEIYSNLRKIIPPFMYNTPTFSNFVESELIKAEKESQ